MVYQKQAPNGGFPFEGIVPSAALTNMDNGIANAIDGQNGGTYPGPLTLTATNTILTGNLIMPDGYAAFGSDLGLTINAGHSKTIEVGSGWEVLLDTGSSFVTGAVTATFGASSDLQTFGVITLGSGGSLVATSGSNITANPGSRVSVAAPLSLSGTLTQNFRTVTSNYTVDSSGADIMILLDTTSGPITLTLPTPTPGRILFVKSKTTAAAVSFFYPTGHIDNNALSSTPSYGDTLQGWILACDGTDWWIMNTWTTS